MAASAVVTVRDRRWMPVTQDRRALVLTVRFAVLDPAPTEVLVINQEIRYPPAAFENMTQQQAVVAIRDDGVGGVPSLKAIALGLVDDWNKTAGVRQVAFPITFTP